MSFTESKRALLVVLACSASPFLCADVALIDEKSLTSFATSGSDKFIAIMSAAPKEAAAFFFPDPTKRRDQRDLHHPGSNPPKARPAAPVAVAKPQVQRSGLSNVNVEFGIIPKDGVEELKSAVPKLASMDAVFAARFASAHSDEEKKAKTKAITELEAVLTVHFKSCSEADKKRIDELIRNCGVPTAPEKVSKPTTKGVIYCTIKMEGSASMTARLELRKKLIDLFFQLKNEREANKSSSASSSRDSTPFPVGDEELAAEEWGSQ